MRKIIVLALCMIVLVSGCITITDDAKPSEDREEKKSLPDRLDINDECEFPDCMSPEEYENLTLPNK